MRLPPGYIAEVKARTSLVELIGGEVQRLRRAGQDYVGLCPFHSERRPSFNIVERKGFYYCFGCGARGNAVDWVMQTHHADFRQAVAYLAQRAGMAPIDGLGSGGRPLEKKPIVQLGNTEIAAERERKIAEAREIWAGKQSIEWTAAERYLRDARNISIALPPTLGFVSTGHPFLRRADVKLPAMIAPVQLPTPDHSGRIVGVHLTFLAPDGSGKMGCPPGFEPADWKAKIMRGECRGAAVRLTPPERLMIVAEGIETSLAILQALYDPDLGVPHLDGEVCGVWAGLSLGNLGEIVFPELVREMIIAADGDTKIPTVGALSKTPEEHVEAQAEKHRRNGLTVRVAWPPAGSDFNSLLAPGSGYAAGEIAA